MIFKKKTKTKKMTIFEIDCTGTDYEMDKMKYFRRQRMSKLDKI